MDDNVVGAWEDPPKDSFDYITGPAPAPVAPSETYTSLTFKGVPEFKVVDFSLGQVSKDIYYRYLFWLMLKCVIRCGINSLQFVSVGNRMLM